MKPFVSPVSRPCDEARCLYKTLAQEGTLANRKEMRKGSKKQGSGKGLRLMMNVDLPVRARVRHEGRLTSALAKYFAENFFTQEYCGEILRMPCKKTQKHINIELKKVEHCWCNGGTYRSLRTTGADKPMSVQLQGYSNITI